MFLKEILSIFGFSSIIFVSSGFAIKVKKFENNKLIVDPQDNKLKLYLTNNSYHKIEPKTHQQFTYLKIKGENEITKNISNIERKNNFYELTLTPSSEYQNFQEKIELIKYLVESKTFWSNLFT
ncbi:hypothetical protein [Mycoplasma parvum]|uniref:Uncharacterized protein n=1 Tax=Mycoplasma parvum str. Indiana TaxID=1403316 RepID=U5ND18_9MOLU|nr:hypothetical protein [Mycoplasma parvum]AGX89317.1 hypothetical protein PRV_02955 [Mycoplasma parvum str. Indiana]